MESINKISWKILGDSLKEVIILVIFAILPIIINFFIEAVAKANTSDALTNIIVPRELLTYSLSFLSPTLYLILVKNNGTGYKLPMGSIVSISCFIIYIVCLSIYLINKNGWLSLENPSTFYFKFTVIFLIITLIFRVYTTYHNKNSTNFFATRESQQDNFNEKLANKIKGN